MRLSSLYDTIEPTDIAIPRIGHFRTFERGSERMAYPLNMKLRAIQLLEARGSATQAATELGREREFQNELHFPDERTIRRWYANRAEHTSKAKKKHASEIGTIADYIWAQGLSSVVPSTTKRGDQFDIFVYVVMDKGVGQGVTREWLAKRILDVWSNTHDWFDHWKLECLCEHIRAEIPGIGDSDFWTFMEQDPYKFVEAVGTLIRRKTLKGTCPICKGWN